MSMKAGFTSHHELAEYRDRGYGSLAGSNTKNLTLDLFHESVEMVELSGRAHFSDEKEGDVEEQLGESSEVHGVCIGAA